MPITMKNMLNEISDNYNYYEYNKPLLSGSNRDIVLSELKYRNMFDDIRRNSTILNTFYQSKNAVIDTIIQIIDREKIKSNHD